MKAKVARIAIPVIMALFLILVMASPAFAAATVTPASGGGAISADDFGTGTYTDLGAIVIAEGAIGDIGVGTIILDVPTGFEFRTAPAPDVAVTGAGELVATFTSITTTQITITVTTASATATNTLTIGGVSAIGVRPTQGIPLASGNIIMDAASTSTILGVTTGPGGTNFGTLTEVPGTAASFNVVTSGGGTETAGAAFSVTLTALDTYGNTCDSGPNAYTGAHTINFASAATPSPNGTPPTIPASESINFTAGVGTSLTSFILTNAEEIVAPTIGATDGIVTGFSAPITVNPGPAVSFNVVTSGGGTETAGVAFSVTLTALDAYGNTCDSGLNAYTGAHTINFTSTATNSPNGTAPTIPASESINFAAGVGTSSTGFILVNPGETPTITASETAGPSGTSAPITVNPAALASYTVAPAAGPYTAGVAFTVTTTGYDAYGNVVTNDSTSIVTYTSNSATMVFDANQDGTFTDNSEALAAGVSVIDVKDNTAASGVTITATTGAVSGVSPAITINPAAINYYTVTSASYNQTAGVAFTVTVTAYDQYGNVVTTDSTTSVTMTSSSATMLFDSNGNGIFGQRGDNIKTLSAGTFNIPARDTIGRSGVTITATDPNGNTGTSSPYTISGWTGQAGPGAAPPAAPPPAAAAPPSGGMPVGALAGLWAGVAVICGLIIWLGIFRR